MDDPAILEERIARNRHAREVIAGLDVTPGMHERPGAPPPSWAGSRAAMPSFSSPRTIYILCVVALLLAGTIVAIVAGGLAASVIFFVASLALLGAYFVF